MIHKEVQDFRLGLASVTGRGIVFEGITYSNAMMIKRRWFEAAEKTENGLFLFFMIQLIVLISSFMIMMELSLQAP